MTVNLRKSGRMQLLVVLMQLIVCSHLSAEAAANMDDGQIAAAAANADAAATDADTANSGVVAEGTGESIAATPEDAVDVGAEESVSPCAPVTCSHHGVCVIKNDEPMCACDEGFAPDPTTGLSCQPVASAPMAMPAPTIDEEQKAIQVALRLESPPDVAYCLQYKSLKPDSHCANYWYDYYSRKRGSSLLILIPGILGIGAGAVMGLVVDPVAGVAVGSGGIIITTIGAVMLAKNIRRVRSLQPLAVTYASRSDSHRPDVARQSRFVWDGLALSMRF